MKMDKIFIWELTLYIFICIHKGSSKPAEDVSEANASPSSYFPVEIYPAYFASPDAQIHNPEYDITDSNIHSKSDYKTDVSPDFYAASGDSHDFSSIDKHGGYGKIDISIQYGVSKQHEGADNVDDSSNVGDRQPPDPNSRYEDISSIPFYLTPRRKSDYPYAFYSQEPNDFMAYPSPIKAQNLKKPDRLVKVASHSNINIGVLKDRLSEHGLILDPKKSVINVGTKKNNIQQYYLKPDIRYAVESKVVNSMLHGVPDNLPNFTSISDPLEPYASHISSSVVMPPLSFIAKSKNKSKQDIEVAESIISKRYYSPRPSMHTHDDDEDVESSFLSTESSIYSTTTPTSNPSLSELESYSVFGQMPQSSAYTINRQNMFPRDSTRNYVPSEDKSIPSTSHRRLLFLNNIRRPYQSQSQYLQSNFYKLKNNFNADSMESSNSAPKTQEEILSSAAANNNDYYAYNQNKFTPNSLPAINTPQRFPQYSKQNGYQTNLDQGMQWPNYQNQLNYPNANSMLYKSSLNTLPVMHSMPMSTSESIYSYYETDEMNPPNDYKYKYISQTMDSPMANTAEYETNGTDNIVAHTVDNDREPQYIPESKSEKEVGKMELISKNQQTYQKLKSEAFRIFIEAALKDFRLRLLQNIDNKKIVILPEEREMLEQKHFYQEDMNLSIIDYLTIYERYADVINDIELSNHILQDIERAKDYLSMKLNKFWLELEDMRTPEEFMQKKNYYKIREKPSGIMNIFYNWYEDLIYNSSTIDEDLIKTELVGIMKKEKRYWVLL